MSARQARIWRSWRSLPGWVQVWVGLILVPVNVLPFFFLDTWSGRAGALAALVVVATNLPIMWVAAGMTRAMSLPHLLAWIPLQIGLLLRVAGKVGAAPPSRAEAVLAVLLLVVNGISLVFDVLDSWRWLKGEREVPGAAA
ncbi:MAG: hypothetical protein KGJ32_04660 [Xanthomonadaceae bacterium]|nr:hypothetical protein [Xanthomonadaceae bacterium]